MDKWALGDGSFPGRLVLYLYTLREPWPGKIPFLVLVYTMEKRMAYRNILRFDRFSNFRHSRLFNVSEQTQGVSIEWALSQAGGSK